MEERQVTIGDTTFPLADPFFVLATQNPIEQEGTYPLPEAQLDRFLLKLTVGYPTKEEELSILRLVGVEERIPLRPILFPSDIRRLREVAAQIRVDERIEEYIVALITASREHNRATHAYSRYIDYGSSPRGTIFLYRAAKVRALLDGRAYVIPEDVKAAATDVLRHRIVLSYEAESEELTPEDVIYNLLSAIPVP